MYTRNIDLNQITIDIYPSHGIAGSTSTLCISVGAGGDVTYNLDFGDGEAAEEEELSDASNAAPLCYNHTYDEGSYNVTANLR